MYYSLRAKSTFSSITGDRHLYVFLHRFRVFEPHRIRLCQRDDGRYQRSGAQGQNQSPQKRYYRLQYQSGLLVATAKASFANPIPGHQGKHTSIYRAWMEWREAESTSVSPCSCLAFYNTFFHITKSERKWDDAQWKRLFGFCVFFLVF